MDFQSIRTITTLYFYTCKEIKCLQQEADKQIQIKDNLKSPFTPSREFKSCNEVLLIISRCKTHIKADVLAVCISGTVRCVLTQCQEHIMSAMILAL